MSFFKFIVQRRPINYNPFAFLNPHIRCNKFATIKISW